MIDMIEHLADKIRSMKFQIDGNCLRMMWPDLYTLENVIKFRHLTERRPHYFPTLYRLMIRSQVLATTTRSNYNCRQDHATNS